MRHQNQVRHQNPGASYRYIGVNSRVVSFTRPAGGGNWRMYVGNDLRVLSYTSANFNVCA